MLRIADIEADELNIALPQDSLRTTLVIESIGNGIFRVGHLA